MVGCCCDESGDYVKEVVSFVSTHERWKREVRKRNDRMERVTGCNDRGGRLVDVLAKGVECENFRGRKEQDAPEFC